MKKVPVKIRRLRDGVTIPTYSTTGSAGFDLYALDDIILRPGEVCLVPLGLAIELPPGVMMDIRPRSGMSLKTPIRISNSPGTIDPDYRGEVGVIVENRGDETYRIEIGTRFAQGVLIPFFQADWMLDDDLSATTRGTGGFGSTG